MTFNTNNKEKILITGSRKGIGKYLAEYYSDKGFYVFGCSREPIDYLLPNYTHYICDITKEKQVKEHFQTSKNKCCKIKPKVNTSVNTIQGNYIPQKLDSADKINANSNALCKIKKERRSS